MNAPAFTPVAVRRTLAGPSPSTKPMPVAFSPGIVSYVQRAFFEFNRRKDSPAFSDITDSDIRGKLSSIVNSATADGQAESRDWSTYPLPHEHLLDERQEAVTSAQSAVLANINHPSLAHANGTQSHATNAKKRKSPDQEVQDETGQPVTPPWKKTSNISLAERVTGKSKTQEKKQKRKDKEHARNNLFDTSQDALERRRQRFGHVSPEPSPFLSSRDHSPANDATTGPIVGTCQTLEKNYFRLTAPPNPSTVRPPAVLEKSLKLVMKKWTTEHDYTYVCDQLKSLRQDLTVQRTKTTFTIKVYERHARIALQMKDLGEYNQCQTQLRALYRMRLGDNGSSGGCEDEFLAYRILYLIYTRNRTDMNNMLADLTTADKKGPFVQLALRVRAALASGNYHRFFQLYRDSQNEGMVPYLMDLFLERERLAAMATTCKSYKPDVSTRFLAAELGFGDDEASNVEGSRHDACVEFIVKHSGTSLLQKKDDDVRFLAGQAGGVFEQVKKAVFGRVDIKGQI